MRLNEHEHPDVVIARLKQNKPKPPKNRRHNGSSYPPSEEATSTYATRLADWNAAMAREQDIKARGQAAVYGDNWHEQAIQEDRERGA
jgi:hypothetical protein